MLVIHAIITNEVTMTNKMEYSIRCRRLNCPLKRSGNSAGKILIQLLTKDTMITMSVRSTNRKEKSEIGLMMPNSSFPITMTVDGSSCDISSERL